MFRTAWVVLTLAVGLSSRAAAQTGRLFIQHVAVVDVIAGQVLPDMTVEIRGRTIAAMRSDRPFRVTRGATVIDGRGKYLIPGLWDMHVHLSFPAGAAQIFLPVMVANGILGARDMHSFLSPIISLKHAVASGAQVGPRLFVAGTAVDGPNRRIPDGKAGTRHGRSPSLNGPEPHGGAGNWILSMLDRP